MHETRHASNKEIALTILIQKAILIYIQILNYFKNTMRNAYKVEEISVEMVQLEYIT